MSRVRVKVRYKPAMHRTDLRKGSKRLAMDAFLMSDQVQDVSSAAARDMARDMRAEAVAAGLVETGGYVQGFDSEASEPVWTTYGPRRAATVYNDDDAAPAVEFGNARVGAGRRIMLRVGNRYHTPKGIA